jgi:hypothetical protein
LGTSSFPMSNPYLICCSSLLIVFCCHCLVHVKKLVCFCVQVRVVMCTSISKLSAVEADGCQVSRLLAACNDFIPTACVRNMRTWGGPGTSIWTWAKRGGHGPRGEDLGGAWQRAEHYLHARKDEPFIFYTAALGSARAHGENSKPGRIIRPKVDGGLTTGACWAPQAVHRDRWLHCACCFNCGPTWTPSRPPACQNHTGFGRGSIELYAGD